LNLYVKTGIGWTNHPTLASPFDETSKGMWEHTDLKGFQRFQARARYTLGKRLIQVLRFETRDGEKIWKDDRFFFILAALLGFGYYYQFLGGNFNSRASMGTEEKDRRMMNWRDLLREKKIQSRLASQSKTEGTEEEKASDQDGERAV
jgi:hypothetical protein